ncbi:double-strand break repair protein AddB [Azospirillum rugosum]|uniref:ATP-dependent helicase/nuclease subunit B n=1 Tax=Azospirillum rugosum TaxID=416170 RepID=A0ABS4SJF3_9PROT|nr:double-strand break repair protein AddB [Azospirillum rugosum]MBP2292208.1 ATP-dependent helicase/nuclease subunit B [Azospirillum rugosum]MDQ0525967.1 ATP-dependent helicase/nuclease subunit B [Azospirillum rugosum]
MTSSAEPKVFTIPSGVSFVDTLAAGIVERVGDDPLALAAVTVLLPTRRSCLSLRDAFLRRSGGRPMLLPRMSPLGELDADTLSLTAEELPGVPLELPDAVTPLKRQLLLARLILQAQGVSATTAQAVRLGADLGRLIDAVWTEGVAFDRLASLVPEDYAQHWQVTLEFLKIVTEHWPVILGSIELTDPAQRRNIVLETQAALWRAEPPQGLVIAAGSTGSIPASADLLAVIARLPQGAVVLPGLDQEADDTAWDAIRRDESHPQHGLAHLLDRLGTTRDGVRRWNDVEEPRAVRARLIAEAMRPAATTESWRELEGLDASALANLTRIDAATAEEEASAIALLMRHALETPEKRAALVTPDRNLARRVAMALSRWGIAVNDSAGQPLVHTAVGTYLRLTAELAASRAHPLALLALAKHPLAAGGRDPSDFRSAARALERTVLRGPRPAEGFGGLIAALKGAEYFAQHEGRKDQQAFLLDWLEGLAKLAAPFMEVLFSEAPIADLVRAHIAFAEKLAARTDMPGEKFLWLQADGEGAAGFVHELLEAAEGFPAVPGTDYPALLDALMAMRPVYPRYGLHSRLWILGPMEARLQHFDLMILGGLNEGTWPPDPAADPWMSRPMRRDFGLPSPERMVGLSAHDFTHACGAPEVVLTRAERVDGTPTVPSRWLLRLETVLRALNLDGRIDLAGEPWLVWARGLDEPDAVRPVSPPEPRPPVAARPRKLSVTKIERWMRDPYAVYAEHVLRLRKLDPIAADPGAADRGQFIHSALDAFVREYPGLLPQDALHRLIDLGRESFGPLLQTHPDVWAFWWPRFERIAEWFIALERDRRLTVKPLTTEVSGELTLNGPAGPFLLTAKADRIDSTGEGLVLIDYKTGTPPSTREIELGFAPQLPLEAAIALAGGFGGVAAGTVAELSFWRLSGGDPAGEEKPVKGDPATLAAEARAGLEELIRHFDDPATPYRSCPRPAMAPRYTDYAHLARVQEWSAGGDGGEG